MHVGRLGSCLGLLRAPRGARWGLKGSQIKRFENSGCHLEPPRAPKAPPRRPQEPSRTLQDRPGAARKRPGALKCGPREPQDSLWRRPRGSKHCQKLGSKGYPGFDPSWRVKKSVYERENGRFFGCQLELFFGLQVRCSLIPRGPKWSPRRPKTGRDQHCKCKSFSCSAYRRPSPTREKALCHAPSLVYVVLFKTTL